MGGSTGVSNGNTPDSSDLNLSDETTSALLVFMRKLANGEIDKRIYSDTFMQFITNYIKTTNQFNGKMSFDEYLSQYIEAYVEHQLENSDSTIYASVKKIADKAVSDSKTTTK